MVLKSPTAKLRPADARPHMVVCVWFTSQHGEERYLYKREDKWFVYTTAAVMGCRLLDGNERICILDTDDEGYFKGITVDPV